MPGSNDLSAAVKKEEQYDDTKEERGKANNKNHKGKGKGKGKGNGKAKGENHVRDGSPVREISPSRHATDPWDDLRHAWAGEFSRSQAKKSGEGNHQNQNQSQKQQRRQNNNHHNARSGSSQRNKRGRGGGQVHAGQKRRATADVTSVPTDDDGHGGHAPKRHKGERRPPPRSSPEPEPNPDSGGPARSHPDFWYPDGSVIIQVEKTRFRLHQSKLKKFSAYFAAVFPEEGHTRGGRVKVDEGRSNGHHLPVYRVAETTADDFATLLTVIDESMYVRCLRFSPPRHVRRLQSRSLMRVDHTRKYGDETPPMLVLAGVLRAARALSFDLQRKWAERFFGRMWPATLDSLTIDPIPHAAVALALARTCGLRGVQKRASYELLRMPTFGQNIVAAMAAPVRAEEDPRAYASADVGLDKLHRADLLRLLHAREQLGLAWAEAAGKAPTDFVCSRGAQTQVVSEQGGSSSTNISSEGRRGCASANVDFVHARWAEHVHTTGLYVQRMVDPLMGLQDLMEIPWRDEGFCRKCVAARTNMWDELRRKLWDDLDVWLELTAAGNA